MTKDFLNYHMSPRAFPIQSGTFSLPCCTGGTTTLVHISIAIGYYLFALKPTAEPEIKVKIFFFFFIKKKMRVR